MYVYLFSNVSIRRLTFETPLTRYFVDKKNRVKRFASQFRCDMLILREGRRRGRERERERERKREKRKGDKKEKGERWAKIDRQIDGEIDRQTDRQIDRQVDRQIEREIERVKKGYEYKWRQEFIEK